MKKNIIQIRILAVLTVVFFLSIFIGIPINTELSLTIVGITLSIYILYVLFLINTMLMTPSKFFQVIYDKAGDDRTKPKYWGYISMGAMVAVGMVTLFIMMFGWFIFIV